MEWPQVYAARKLRPPLKRFSKLVCNDEKFELHDFSIVEIYRFEGNTDPADEAIVYGIESVKGRKGVLVSGYGISAEGISAEMAKKLTKATI